MILLSDTIMSSSKSNFVSKNENSWDFTDKDFHGVSDSQFVCIFKKSR